MPCPQPRRCSTEFSAAASQPKLPGTLRSWAEQTSVATVVAQAGGVVDKARAHLHVKINQPFLMNMREKKVVHTYPPAARFSPAPGRLLYSLVEGQISASKFGLPLPLA